MNKDYLNYYNNDLNKLIKQIVPAKASVKIISDINTNLKKKHDYIVLKNVIGDIDDIQNYLGKIRKWLKPQGRLIIIYYNHLWEPILKFASFMGWRRQVGEQNWLDTNDIKNILRLSSFDPITVQRRLLIPIDIPLLSNLANRLIAHLPIFNSFCLTTWTVAREEIHKDSKLLSTSIIIPARNEEENIPQIIGQIPKFGGHQEIIFVEGNSRDETWKKIQEETRKKRHRKITVKAFKQKGVGKADAVRLGFKKASENILMILDADLTVNPSELTKFYNVLANGKADFVNGSRLVYPMEKDAMRLLNKAGNKLFSWLFSWILGQNFKDTLCGTKVLLKDDYKKIEDNRKYFGDFDPFGDFDLIFGAVKLNLKTIDVPIRYKERVYGSTNISRFKHGILLAKMTVIAFKRFRGY